MAEGSAAIRALDAPRQAVDSSARDRLRAQKALSMQRARARQAVAEGRPLLRTRGRPRKHFENVIQAASAAVVARIDERHDAADRKLDALAAAVGLDCETVSQLLARRHLVDGQLRQRREQDKFEKQRRRGAETQTQAAELGRKKARVRSDAAAATASAPSAAAAPSTTATSSAPAAQLRLEPVADFVSDAEAAHIQNVAVRLYEYRRSVLRRAPKTEFYKDQFLRYSWGQHKTNDAHARRMPDWMAAIADRIDPDINHAIVIKYHDGVKTHAPWHHDQCEERQRRSGCMKRGTGFHVISCGTPRVFELGQDGTVLWSRALPHRSLLSVTSETNQLFEHRVPQDPTWRGEARWSLIFRTIVGKAAAVP